MEGGLKRGGRRSLCLICFKGLLGEVRLEGYIDYVSSSLVVSFCCFLQEVLLLVLSQVQACSFFLLFLPILLSGCTLSAAVLQFLFVVSLFHDIPEYLDTQDKTCSFFLLFLLNLLQGPHIKGILVVSFCCFIVTARPGRKYSECILVVSFCCFEEGGSIMFQSGRYVLTNNILVVSFCCFIESARLNIPISIQESCSFFLLFRLVHTGFKRRGRDQLLVVSFCCFSCMSRKRGCSIQSLVVSFCCFFPLRSQRVGLHQVFPYEACSFFLLFHLSLHYQPEH